MSSLLTVSGRLEAAITFLEAVAADTRDPKVRKGILEKIVRLKRGELPQTMKEYKSKEVRDGG